MLITPPFLWIISEFFPIVILALKLAFIPKWIFCDDDPIAVQNITAKTLWFFIWPLMAKQCPLTSFTRVSELFYIVPIHSDLPCDKTTPSLKDLSHNLNAWFSTFIRTHSYFCDVGFCNLWNNLLLSFMRKNKHSVEKFEYLGSGDKTIPKVSFSSCLIPSDTAIFILPSGM